MKERPILFKGPMVKAILDGTKTQTRRVVKPQPPDDATDVFVWLAGERKPGLTYAPEGCWYDVEAGRRFHKPCPYGQPGDHLWVRETHYLRGRWIKNGRTKTGRQRWRFRPAKGRAVRYVEAPPKRLGRKRGARKDQWWKRPSIFMPRWASRITLEVTGLRVERVQEITPAAAKAEGADPYLLHPWGANRIGYVAAFVNLWDSINAKRGYGWDVNPWVWVVEFKRIRP
jgi:hypothetical protein